MSRLLDPHMLMTIKNLSLAAKTVIDGFMAGMHKSTVKGTGLEFSQYRSYQPGDDLRWLDWKMYARSDRYYIRESEMETNIAVHLLIDASRSMLHQDGGFTKIDYARYLAASLAYLAHSQGDATGLSVFKEGELFSLRTGNDPQHLSRLYYQLEQLQPGGRFTSPIQYKQLFTGERKREMLVFITDLHEQQEEITTLLSALAALRHEVIVFQLLGRNELELEYAGYTQLEDLETGEQTGFRSSDAPQYKDRLQQHLARLRRRMLEEHIAYQLMAMDQPLDEALGAFLQQRQRSIIS